MNCKKLEIRISHTFYLDIWPLCSLQTIPEIKQEEFGSTVLCCVPDLIAGPCAVLNLRLVPVVGLEHLGCSTRCFSQVRFQPIKGRLPIQ